MKAEDLGARLLQFAVRVIRLAAVIRRTPEGAHIASQLLRSGTSAGANYEEACGAESRRDFAHKIGIALKELKESRYWLRLVHALPLVRPESRIEPLLREAEELVAILGKSLSTCRKSPGIGAPNEK